MNMINKKQHFRDCIKEVLFYFMREKEPKSNGLQISLTRQLQAYQRLLRYKQFPLSQVLN